MNKEIDLTSANYGTTKGLDYQIAIIPWGAIEPHNLHLPYLTDTILAQAIAIDSAAIALKKYKIRAMVLPAIPLGQQNPGQRELKFCIHGRYETQKAILTDIAESLRYQGIKRILIINGHGGNSFKNMIRDLAVDMPDMLIAVTDWYNALPTNEYFDNPGDHAGELETSVMMYYHPEYVDLDDAGSGESGGFASKSLASGLAWVPRNWSKVSIDTGIGDPSQSSAEKGQRYVADLAEAYADLIRDLIKPEFYLPI